MLITVETAVKVRKKRAVEQLTKKDLSEKLGIKSQTLTKVETGNYDAPRRIYQSVMDWLINDL